MCQKVVYLFLLFVLCSSISQGADIEWRGGGVNNLWSNPDNWQFNSVPIASDNVFLRFPHAQAPNGPVIREGIDARANGLSTEVAGESTMTMTGGTLTLTDYVWWGDEAGSHGIFYMSGGTITVGNEFELGWGGGTGTWTMTGGTITAAELIIPTNSGASGQFYLHGGTFNVGSLGLSMTATGLIDVGKGVLVLEGDLTTIVKDFVRAGQITAYGGVGTVVVTYDGRNTTVTAVGAPEALEPKPADGQTDVPRDVVLGWKPGVYSPPTNGHKVYFGESFRDVNDGIGGIAQDANSYAPPQLLDFGTTYYWRVDEVNGPPDYTVYQGDVWSFTTEPIGYPIDGANITATASSAGQENLGPENTINGSGLDDNDLHSVEPADMWLSGNEPLGAWIQYELDKVYKLHEMWVWNSNQVFEPLFGFGMKDVTVEYSTNGADWTALADVPEFTKAPGTGGYAHDTTVDFGGGLAKYVRLAATSNWGGVLPQFGLSEVRLFYIPVRARKPSPDSGAADAAVDGTLSWRAGREAATHDVYLSTDEQAVIDGTVPAVSVTDASYSPSPLDLASTYYWRIDEVNDVEAPTTWQGDLWNFTTEEFIVVDGFEDYNDWPPHEIYTTWPDGYENPANGSQVGNLSPPFAETTIVHGDDQSMPVFYSNTGGATYSEAE
ncbi:MAG: discoidin domain-containing protein, partial [Planctomycetota bacterium]